MENLENLTSNSESYNESWIRRQWKKHRKSRYFVPIATGIIIYNAATKLGIPGYLIYKTFLQENEKTAKITKQEEPKIYFVDFIQSADAGDYKR